MEKVITNLITNAIKYSPEKSTVNISATVENKYLSISVQDNGYGIPAEDLQRVFDRFYRVKDKNTRTTLGTGLGLSIVKSIIEAHQGNIAVESKPGEGAVHLLFYYRQPTLSRNLSQIKQRHFQQEK